ncbi:MAG: TetR/AcrR family transcriptional regulator [Chloroflexi bacterium]|nr:MAG: TetR/AcrR family transcriptional regulator [Chloroflexota bacterium]
MTARRGRPPGGSQTRSRILASARRLFGERGFEGASVRAIAAEARVDPALIHHYFGTKHALYLAATELPFDPRAPQRLLEPGIEGLGERLVGFALDIWDRPDFAPVIAGIVRSAAADPAAAAQLREIVIRQVLTPLAAALGRPDAELRATLAGSQMIGLAFARLIVRVEPLASAERERIVRAVGPTIQRYLTGDLDD